MITQTFELNLIPDSPPVVVHCDQYDRGSGRLKASLFDGDMPYTPSGVACIQGTKPDGKGFVYQASFSGNIVTADLTQQMTAVSGSVRTQIVITESTGRTGTFAFNIEVQASALPDDTDMSETDLELIEQGIEAGQQAIASAAAASSSATSAANSAASASDSAASAAYSETAASGSASDAAASKTRAVTAETNARQSANEAAVSASEAEASARRSATSAGEASDFASAAEAAESTVEALKNSAGTFARAAKSYRDEAEAWAVGQKDGEDVSASDPTYHNNSKWHALMSAGSAASASATLEQVRTAGENAVTAIEEAADEATPEFTVNLSDGHLYYTGGRFDFVVDSNGHLTWQITA